MISPANFKDELIEKFIDIHWQQWSSIGIASHVKETGRIIDLEALLISSFFISSHDKRLILSVLEWINKYKEMISTSRINRMGKLFSINIPNLNKSIIDKQIFQYILKILKPGLEDIKKEKYIPQEWIDISSGNMIRNSTVEPVIQKQPLLQLWLRSIFGINARPEIFLYLLLEKKGNANQIANEIYYDQKIVHRILTKWCKTNFVNLEHRSNEKLYSLDGGKELIKSLKIKGNYFNWCRFFYFYSTLITYACTEPWSNDAYLMSSIFRDIYNEAKIIGNNFNIKIPEKNLYKGEDLFDPMASQLLKIISCLIAR